MRPAQNHLTPLLLAHLRARSPEPEVVARHVVPHLLSLCPICRVADEELRRLRQEVRHWDEVIVVTEGKEAPRLWRRFEHLSAADRLRAVAADETTRRWGFCRLLQRRSQEAAAGGDAARAVELAQLALGVAERLDESYDPEWVADLQAGCRALLGTARRLAGDLAGAAEAFELGRRLLPDGTGDPGVEGEVMAQEALLLRDERRLSAAAEHLRRAIEALEEAAEKAAEAFEVDEMKQAARVARVHLAWCLYHQGAAGAGAGAALAILHEAQRHFDFRRDRAEGLGMQLGKVWCHLAIGGEHGLAATRKAVAFAREVAERDQGGAEALRLKLAEARLRRRPAGAAALLRPAAWELARSGLGVDAALCCMELAAVALRAEGTGGRGGGREWGGGRGRGGGRGGGRGRGGGKAASAEVLPALAAESRVLLAGADLGGAGGEAIVRRFQEGCESGLTLDALRRLAQELERSRRPAVGWWSVWGTTLEERADER